MTVATGIIIRDYKTYSTDPFSIRHPSSLLLPVIQFSVVGILLPSVQINAIRFYHIGRWACHSIVLMTPIALYCCTIDQNWYLPSFPLIRLEGVNLARMIPLIDSIRLVPFIPFSID